MFETGMNMGDKAMAPASKSQRFSRICLATTEKKLSNGEVFMNVKPKCNCNPKCFNLLNDALDPINPVGNNLNSVDRVGKKSGYF